MRDILAEAYNGGVRSVAILFLLGACGGPSTSVTGYVNGQHFNLTHATLSTGRIVLSDSDGQLTIDLQQTSAQVGTFGVNTLAMPSVMVAFAILNIRDVAVSGGTVVISKASSTEVAGSVDVKLAQDELTGPFDAR
jgi:hypothetical protein